MSHNLNSDTPNLPLSLRRPVAIAVFSVAAILCTASSIRNHLHFQAFEQRGRDTVATLIASEVRPYSFIENLLHKDSNSELILVDIFETADGVHQRHTETLSTNTYRRAFDAEDYRTRMVRYLIDAPEEAVISRSVKGLDKIVNLWWDRKLLMVIAAFLCGGFAWYSWERQEDDFIRLDELIDD